MNLDRWKHLIDAKTPPDAMDWRHVQMINAMLVSEVPATIVEIGCARGFSTSAIIEAAEATGGIKWVDLVDPAPTIALVNAVLSKRADHVSAQFMLHPEHSQKFTKQAECWLIDGDHDEGALIDYLNARTAKARIIAIHDSSSHECIGRHLGAFEIAGKLKSEASAWFEDKKKRDGEFTERGLIIGFFGEYKTHTMQRLQELSN